jgi:regulator of sigma E protease
MIQIAQILFILSVLVILHEFGHFIAARAFKVRVEKFYLFMDAGFSLFKKKIGETEWGIGWLPIGGYVKLSGMIDESLDTAQMNEAPQPWEFRAKPAWQRLIIMLAGIIVNLLLAWFIYSITYMTVGQKIISTEKIQKNGLEFSEVGEKSGFKTGDKILTVDGKRQDNFNRLTIDILLSDEVKVLRDDKEVAIALTDEDKKNILSKEGRNFMFPIIKNVIVDSVLPKSAAQKIGLVKGDKIIMVNQDTITNFPFFRAQLAMHKTDSISLTVVRKNQTMVLEGVVNKEGKLGFDYVRPTQKELKRDYIDIEIMPFGKAISSAVKESYTMFIYNIKQFKLILKPKTEAYKQIKSPVGIARQLPDEWDWEYIWGFTALFSIGLAFMNLLPIPGLDGGHALFTIAEMITGRKLSDKAMGYVQTGGMIILLSLMALTFGKDIYQLIADKIL